MSNKPEVTHLGLFDMQVCVPKTWNDEQVLAFAEQEALCGTEKGWTIRKEGDSALCGAPERVQCEDEDRQDFIHIMLDA